jgi:Uma2 family endonuclease
VSPTKTLMTAEEYLRTSFEGVDREYVDREIVERPMPTYDHGEIQAR